MQRTIRHINSRDYSQAEFESWASDEQDPVLWEKRMRGICPFIAEIDGVAVGYADLQASGLIDHFFCHHNYQRQGVGTALMEQLFSVGETKGIERYYSCLLYTSPSPRDATLSRMPSSA